MILMARVAVAIAILVVAAGLAALWWIHTPSVRAQVVAQLEALVDEATGLHLRLESLEYSVPGGWFETGPGALNTPDGRTLVTWRHLRATWDWMPLLSDQRIERIQLDAPHVDLDALDDLPERPADAGGGGEQAFEIADLGVTEMSLSAAGPPVDLWCDGLRIQASVSSVRSRALVEGTSVLLDRAGRRLELGPVRAEVLQSGGEVRVEELAIEGDQVGLRGDGVYSLGGPVSFEGTARLSAELVAWWDPDIAATIDPVGSLEGPWRVSAADGLVATFEHRGGPLRAAGMVVEAFEASYEDGRARLDMAGPQWGSAQGSVWPEGFDLEAEFRQWRFAGAARALAPELLIDPRVRDLEVSGRVEAAGSLPVDPEAVTAHIDLSMTGAGGRGRVVGMFEKGVARMDPLSVEVAGVSVRGRGTVDVRGAVNADVEVSVPDPAVLDRWVARLRPELAGVELGGGALTATATVRGPMRHPRLGAELRWDRPEIGGRAADFVEITVRGRPDDLECTARMRGPGGLDVTVDGVVAPHQPMATTAWGFEVAAVDRLAESWLEDRVPAEFGHGRLAGRGELAWTPSAVTASGHLEVEETEVEGVVIDRAGTRFTWADGRLEFSGFELAAGAAELTASGWLAPGPVIQETQFEVAGAWRGVDPGRFVRHPLAAGAVSGAVEARGSIADPSGTGWVEFSPEDDRLGAVRAEVEVGGGRLQWRSSPWRTPAGTLETNGEVVLEGTGGTPGIVPRRLSAGVNLNGWSSLESLDLFGLDPVPFDLQGDVTAAVQWDRALGLPQVQATLADGRLVSEVQTVVFDGPVPAAFDGEVVRVDDLFASNGEGTTILAGGSYDLADGVVDLAATAHLDPTTGDRLPVPVQIDRPVVAEIRIQGPPDRLHGWVRVDHERGVIEHRDPLVRVGDLELSLALERGVVRVQEGSFALNQGRVDVGGGWNPEVGQGLVFELDRVVFLYGGILSRWSGTLGLEPAGGRLARVVGDLYLDGGLWDQDVDVAGMVLGTAGGAASEFLGQIDLDVGVESRGTLRVDNNLGAFDVRWTRLEVGGTVAQPVIQGDVRILPGAMVQLGGAGVPLESGTLRFTGDPLTDPLVDLVPADSVVGPTAPGGGSYSAAAAVTQGLGSILGFDNETIPLSEIASETDTDTTTEFAIGRRLSSSVALFLTTDLRSAQERTTLLQLWRLPGLPGLRLQAKTQTSTGESDLRAVQSFRWGGTEGTVERPKVRRVRFEGDWPVWRWRLSRVPGIAAGDSLDRFQLLAGEVRLERWLAERGWTQANVDAELRGDKARPEVVFTCTPGSHVEIEFEGDGLPREVKRRAREAYRFPPAEAVSLRQIEELVASELRARGYRNAVATARTEAEDGVVVQVERGEQWDVLGPELRGVPGGLVGEIRAALGRPAELRAIADDPSRGERIVTRALARRGYRRPERVDVVVREDSGARLVTIDVDPGPLSRIEDVAVLGEDPLGLGNVAGLEPGDPVDLQRIAGAAGQLKRRYREAGYAEARVDARVEEAGDGDYRVAWEINPGRRVRIVDVQVEGTRHLRPSVVRRALDVGEDGTLDLSELDVAAGRLATFPPVDRVEVRVEGAGDERVVIQRIEEKPRWSVEVGAGWNSDYGAEFRGAVRDDNLGGRGLSLYLGGRWQERSQENRLVLSLPPRPGGRLGFGMTLGYDVTPRPVLQEGDLEIEDQVQQASLDARYELRPTSLLRGYLRFTRTRTVEIDPIDPDFALDLTTDLGIVGVQWIEDRFDNPIDPRDGWYLAADFSTATEVLGSDTENVRLLLTGSLAHEFRADWTWLQTVRLGGAEPLKDYILDDQSRFFAGGPASIRGFEIDTVGPVEQIGGTLRYVGGGALFILNQELRFPVWQDLRGAVFADAGQVWPLWSEVDGDLAVGAGLGLRWGTPIGPLWVDAAWPVAEKGENEGVRWTFGIGRTF